MTSLIDRSFDYPLRFATVQFASNEMNLWPRECTGNEQNGQQWSDDTPHQPKTAKQPNGSPLAGSGTRSPAPAGAKKKTSPVQSKHSCVWSRPSWFSRR